MTTRNPCLDFEPQLDEMLADPVVQAVMARDGVDRDDLLDLVSSVQERLVQSEWEDWPVTEA